MVTMRVTAKVANRLKVKLEHATSQSTGKLGDWYVNHIIVRRQHLLIAVSERTLLPVVIPARDLKIFPHRLAHDLESMLRILGISEESIRAETKEMFRWTFAKTDSRQMLGSMNDFVKVLDTFMDDGAPVLKQALRLATAPCSPIGMDSPIEATCQLFGVEAPREIYNFDFQLPEAFQ